jgi:hypothetical protein
MRNGKITPETILKRQCVSYLNWQHIFHFPIMQGFASVKGIPDRIAIKDGKFYGLEFKAGKGKLSEYQEKFKKEVEGAGGIYIEVREVEDLQKHFGV